MFWNNKIQQRKQRREKYVVWEERCVRCQHLIIKYVTRYHSLECTVCRAPDRDREPPCLSCQDYCRSVQIICLSLKIFPLYFQLTTVGLLSTLSLRKIFVWVRLLGTHTKARPGQLWQILLECLEMKFNSRYHRKQLMFTDKRKNWNLITNETWDLGQMEIHRRQAQNDNYIPLLPDWLTESRITILT